MRAATLAIAVFLTIALTSTGLDYVTGDVSHDEERFFAADVMTWGVTALVIALVSAVALLLRSSKLFIVASLAAGITYLLFATNQATVVFASGVADDWRMGVNMLCFGGVWLTLCAKTAIDDYVQRARDQDSGA